MVQNNWNLYPYCTSPTRATGFKRKHQLEGKGSPTLFVKSEKIKSFDLNANTDPMPAQQLTMAEQKRGNGGEGEKRKNSNLYSPLP